MDRTKTAREMVVRRDDTMRAVISQAVASEKTLGIAGMAVFLAGKKIAPAVIYRVLAESFHRKVLH